jgi:hypothetical protein
METEVDTEDAADMDFICASFNTTYMRWEQQAFDYGRNSIIEKDKKPLPSNCTPPHRAGVQVTVTVGSVYQWYLIQ